MRQLKREMKARLRNRAFLEKLQELSGVSLRQMINPLFSFLCDADEIVRWRAVTAFGEVVSRLAEQDV
jgi:HEAT repeat protein